MGLEAVIATQVIDTTSVGRSLMTAADAAAARTAISFDESVDDRVSSLLVAGTNITITYNDAANTLTIAASGGGLSGTGSVDNAALRADGTGGATLQNSAWIINDNLTASPNNTVNHACLEATGGTTNVSVSIKPKGTGAFCLSPPDGSATGGNARGANAIDLQTSRNAATEVASGAFAWALGYRNTVSGADGAGAIGGLNTVSGRYAVAIGRSNTAAAESSWVMGEGCTINSGSSYSFVTGLISTATNSLYSAAIGLFCGTSSSDFGMATGYYSLASRYGQWARSAGRFAAAGDAQSVAFQARNVTTSAVATELYLNGSSTRLTIPSGKVMSALVRIVGVKSDGSEVIKFLRDVTIKNVGGTTSLETSPVAIGTDINVSAATLDLSADNTNDTLKIAVTPPAGTWRWHAIVECANEIAYGT